MDMDTRIVGKRVIYHEELSSTQDAADKLARSGAEEGLVVIAGKQIQGRGRKGRRWLSPSGGGVYLSIILRPPLSPVNVVQIPMVAGIAVATAIRKTTQLQAKIKWPNDIYIGRKKVAGILTEINCEMDRVNYIILGIGINVNTKIASLSKEVQGIATSLIDELDKNVSRVNLIRQFLTEFEKAYLLYVKRGLKPILLKWKTLNNTLGSRVRIYDSDTEISGKAIDLDSEGFLLVKDDAGSVHKIICGDVSLRNLDI